MAVAKKIDKRTKAYRDAHGATYFTKAVPLDTATARKIASESPSSRRESRPLEQSTSIPDAGFVLKINNRQGRLITTLDINEDGIVIYPVNARKGRKQRKRLSWQNYFNMVRMIEQLGD